MELPLGEKSLRVFDYLSRYTDEFKGYSKEAIVIVALAEFFVRRGVCQVIDDSIGRLSTDDGWDVVLADGKVLCQTKRKAP